MKEHHLRQKNNFKQMEIELKKTRVSKDTTTCLNLKISGKDHLGRFKI